MSDSEAPAVRRCAIYTRKSTNPLFDQEISSLQTQREICSAYILSQQHKGWVEMPARYDDAGYSGADPHRPALSQLMRDIESGLVDVVVIYKFDRLTRSLADFVRLLEIFDRFGIPFVSITQAFDTSDSMGRMIVNILLTFSQFERELISDRVRDNIQMRKRHGKWHGGMAPLGYEIVHKKLQIHPAEADVVRFIFAEFIRRGTYQAVNRAVAAASLRSAVKYTRSGVRRGGRLLSSGMVHKVLNNPVYVGEISGAEQTTYPGEHQPIISRETWDAASALRATREKPAPHSKSTNHFLPGLLWDDLGRQMMLSIEKDRGRLYHYYVSSNAQWSQRTYRRQYRSHAERLDTLVVVSVANFLADRAKLRTALKSLGIYGLELDKLAQKGPAAADLLSKAAPESRRELFFALIGVVELGRQHLSITFRSIELRRFLLWSGQSQFRGRPVEWSWSDAKYVLEIPVCAVSAQRSPVLHLATRQRAISATPNRSLVELIQRARLAQRRVEEERERPIADLARDFRCRPSHFSRLIRLNYLAPDIVTAILDGTQPAALTQAILFNADLPLDWSLQRRLFGFSEPERQIGAVHGGRSAGGLPSLAGF